MSYIQKGTSEFRMASMRYLLVVLILLLSYTAHNH